jgi:16S rRNA C1402 (ribose-2'-O) methylase RsmI
MGIRRRNYLEHFKKLEHPLVFYESPYRLAESLADLLAVLGPRRAFLAREMTKLHEEYFSAPLDVLLSDVREKPRKGEITLVVEGFAAKSLACQNDANGAFGENGGGEASYQEFVANREEIILDPRPVKILAREWALKTGMARKSLYAVIDGWRKEEKEPDEKEKEKGG